MIELSPDRSSQIPEPLARIRLPEHTDRISGVKELVKEIFREFPSILAEAAVLNLYVLFPISTIIPTLFFVPSWAKAMVQYNKNIEKINNDPDAYELEDWISFERQTNLLLKIFKGGGFIGLISLSYNAKRICRFAILYFKFNIEVNQSPFLFVKEGVESFLFITWILVLCIGVEQSFNKRIQLQKETELVKINHQIQQDLTWLRNFAHLPENLGALEEKLFSFKEEYTEKRAQWLQDVILTCLKNGVDLGGYDWYLPVCKGTVLRELSMPAVLADKNHYPPTLYKHLVQIDNLRAEFQKLSADQKARLEKACLSNEEKVQVDEDITKMHQQVTEIAYPLQQRCAPLFQGAVVQAKKWHAIKTFNLFALLNQQWEALKQLKADLFFTLPMIEEDEDWVIEEEEDRAGL